MEQPRVHSRGSVPNIDYDNKRRETEPSARQAKTRSRSPLVSYKDTSSNITNSAEFSKTEGFAASLSRSQTLNSSQQRTRPSQPVSHTESEVRTYSKTGDYLRRHDGFRRTGSMQMSNFNDAPRDATYNFGPPQSLHTICNGNNMTNSVPQSQEKHASSGSNTLTSGAASGTTASMSSHCKNCKRLEEQERILAYSLNQVLNHVTDIVDKENAWRQGTVAFSIGNFNWINDEDRTIDPQILKRTDSGRLLVEVKKQVIEMRKKFEDLILDVENLSKTNLYQDVQLIKPKDIRLVTEDSSPGRSNTGKKLLASIADAKQYIESLKAAVLAEEIPTEIREEIRYKNQQSEPINQNIARTLMLQLDQSKRERRALEIELMLQKKKVLQNQNMLNTSYLKEIIRQIVDEEIRSSQNNNSP